MRRLGSWNGSAADGRQTTRSDWGRLVLFAGALVVSSRGYHDHFIDFLPWWRWPLELAIGAALLGAALRDGRPLVESPRRRWLRYGAGVAAGGALLLAADYGPQLGHELAAGIATLVALGAFVLGRWVPFDPDDVRSLMGGAVDAAPPVRNGTRPGLALLGIGVAIAAAVGNQTHHLAAFLLWLLSLVLFAAAWWERGAPVDAGERWQATGGPRLSRRAEALGLLLILALAFALRFPLLEERPLLIDPDEGRQGSYAEYMWRNGFPDAFGLGWNGFANLAFMADYVGVQALGKSNVNLRRAVALYGFLSLIPAFFWVRRWWGSVVALLAVLLLTINHEHIFWSRLALNNVHQVLVAGLMLATFARALQTRRSIDWVWFGYACGLAFHIYHAAKLYPALLAAAALLFAIGIRGFLRPYVRGASIGAVAFLLCFGPLMVSIYQDWDTFYRNTSNRVDLYELTGAYRAGNIEQVRNYVSAHVPGTLYAFISSPYKQAIFDPYECVPFLLGVGWMLWRWRDPRHLVALAWVAGILIVGGMITSYPPNKPRLIGFLPVICLIPAILAGRLRALLHRCAPARADAVMAPLLLLWIGAALYENWYTEFVYRPVLHRGDVLTTLCRLLPSTPLPTTIYTAGAAGMEEPRVATTDCMVAPAKERVLVNLADDAMIVPIPPTNVGNAVLLVLPRAAELLPLIRHYYPDAHHEIVTTATDVVALHIFTLSTAEIDRQRGMRVTYSSATQSGTLPANSESLKAPEQSALPVEVSGRGQVWLATPGDYAFRSSGGTLAVDGTPVDQRPHHFAAGWHAIAVNATLHTLSDVVTLDWQTPDVAEWAAIPRAVLAAHPEAHGLLARAFGEVINATGASPIAQEAAYTYIEPALSFEYLSQIDDPPPKPVGQRPSTMEWLGTVELPEGDGHELRLEATRPTQVFFDGTLVLSAPGGRGMPPVEATLTGPRRRASLLVRTSRAANDMADYEYWKLRLLWRTPGGGWTAFADYRPPGYEAPAMR